MTSIEVPDTLQGCDPAALQAYVTASIVNFTSNPTFASLLNHTPDTIKNATLQILQQQAAAGRQQQQQHPAGLPGASLPTPEVASPLHQAPTTTTTTTNDDPNNIDFILAFRHDCLNVGCSDLRCQLCTHAQARRCSKNFCTKYLVGDTLKAECGAPIRVEALDKFTGQPLPPTAIQNIKLDAVLLNGRSVQQIKESTGGHVTPRDLEDAAMPAYNGKFLLYSIMSDHEKALQQRPQGEDYEAQEILDSLRAAERGAGGASFLTKGRTPEGRAILQFSGSQANISQFVVTGSSEGILSGQRPQFILLLRAINGTTGMPLPSVPPLLSEGFVVATSRVRTAVKKVIPHWNDDVSKLNSVGKATIEKLKDLRQAAIDGGCPDLQLPLARVHTVAEFRQLADWAMQDKDIMIKVKKILKLTKGWDAAREHAALAVQDDNCLRAWWITSSSEEKETREAAPGSSAGGSGGGKAANLVQEHKTEEKQCALVYAADKGVPLFDPGPIAILEIISSSHQHQQQQQRQQQNQGKTEFSTSSAPTAVLRPLLNQNTASGFVGWAVDTIFSDSGLTHHLINSIASRPTSGREPGTATMPSSSSASLNAFIPPSVRASAPPYPSTETILSSHAAWYQPTHSGWISFPLPLTADFLRAHVLSQPDQPLILSSQLMSMCCQYYGRGVQAVQEHVRQQPLPSTLLLPSLPPPPPLPMPPPPPLASVPLQAQAQAPHPPAPAPVAEYNTTGMPSLSTMLHSFPSLPNPEILSRLLSSLPSFDSEQAAVAAAMATGGSVDPQKDVTLQQQANNNTANANAFLGRAISNTASDMLDALFPAAGGSGNSSSLFRGLTPDWGKLSSLSPQEWQQLLQLTEMSPLPGSGNLIDPGGGGLPSRPPSNETAATTPLEPPLRSVSAAKSTFSGKIIDSKEQSPFREPAFPISQSPTPQLPSPSPSRQLGEGKKEGLQQQELMLDEEPSLKLMLPVSELGAADVNPVAISERKKRQSDGGERTAAQGAIKRQEEKEDDGSKGPKQRRLSLP